MRYLHSKLLLVSVSVVALLSGVVALIDFTVMSASAPMTTKNIGAFLGGTGEMKVATFVPTLSREDAIEKAIQYNVRGNAKARAIFDTLSFDATIATYSGINAYGRQWGVQDLKVWVVVFYDYPQDPGSGGPSEAFDSEGLRIGGPWNPDLATITTLLADEPVGPDASGSTYAVGDHVWGVMTWWRSFPSSEYMKWDQFAP